MGGVCPCLAGVDKAAGAAKALPAPAKDKASASSAPLKDNAAPAPLPPLQTVPPKAAEDLTKKPADVPTNEAPVSQDAPDATNEAQGERGLLAGDALEIFSNSYNAWCPGVVYACDNTSVLLAYQVPGEPVDANISTKTLPLDSPEVRLPQDTGSWLLASVEVYSHSKSAWCMGKVTEINGGVLSVVFFYPNEPPDAIPVMKQLAFGDKDLRLRGIDAALSESLQIGSQVEVYSNSLAVWCVGVVQNLQDGVATVHFYYPDMDVNVDQPAVKDLPVGHQDLRMLAADPNYYSGPPVEEADISIGAKLEVFSASRQAWLISEIKDIAEGMVTVQLRYPDMPPDSDMFEKVLPLGHQDMRLPASNEAA